MVGISRSPVSNCRREYRAQVPNDRLCPWGRARCNPAVYCAPKLFPLPLDGVNHGPEVFKGRVQLHVVSWGDDQASIVAYGFHAA